MHDALIVGGGLVGAAAALALARAGYHVALLEQRPPAPLPASGWDARVYAISPGNARWLQDLGVWHRLPAERCQAIRRMDVRGDRGGRLCFDAYEAQAPALAWIVENRQLQTALWDECRDQGVELLQARPLAVETGTTELRCTLDTGRQLTARLLVAADGAASWTRTQAGISVQAQSYAQRGVVANFACARAHEGTAWQWFDSESILAWLPLPQQCVSMVWSVGDALAEDLLALDADAFVRRVHDAGCGMLGVMELLTPPQSFPLQKAKAERLVGPRLVLVGDAAHSVHPLAGQGVNLGFHDVRQLLEPLLQRHEADIGSPALLRRYERARAEEVLLMQSSCDGLQKLFNRAPSWMAPWRNLGLSAVNRSGWLKRQLIAQAMA